MNTEESNRPLSEQEYRLGRWMLENNTAEARPFLPQLENSDVTCWRRKCGRTSIKFQLRGHPEAPSGVRVLGDFVTGEGEEMAGILVFSSDGLLSGIEVYGMAGQAPKTLPQIKDVRSF